MIIIGTILTLYNVYFFSHMIGGGKIHFQPSSFVSLLPFVTSLKESRHVYPLAHIKRMHTDPLCVVSVS